MTKSAFSLYHDALLEVERCARAYAEETIADLTACVVELGGLTLPQGELEAVVTDTVAMCEACLGPYRATPIVEANPLLAHAHGKSSAHVEGVAYDILYTSVMERVSALRAEPTGAKQ